MSLPSETPASGSAKLDVQEYTFAERTFLLKVAHDSILAALEGREFPPIAPTPHVSEPRGVFTTLYLRDALRGCVGYPLAHVPLYRGVIETARAAGFDDSRFAPMTLHEVREVSVSISVLSFLQPVLPEAVEVGKHGLLISQGSRRGLLLPQVPLARGWDRETFLEQTCRKAGLPLDAWRGTAKIEVFTAEVFGDCDN